MMRPNKPYPDFPLFPHPNGQWCKKVNKIPYYFGSWKDDPKGEQAILNWKARQDDIRAGIDTPKPAVKTAVTLTLGRLKDEFLKDRAVQVSAGDLSPRTLADYQTEIATFVQAVGSTLQVAQIGPGHFKAYHDETMIQKRKLGRHARKRIMAYIKAMFRWGHGNDDPKFPLPDFGNSFVAPDTSPEALSMAKERAGEADYSELIVTGDQINQMVKHSSVNMQAVILLGVNIGIGPADLGRLRWSDIDLEHGVFKKPRWKTGVKRRSYIWKRTRRVLIQIKLANQPVETDLVFRTKFGKPFYLETVGTDSEVTCHKVISNYIFGLVRRLRLKGIDLKGVTHQRLRHTFATLGMKARDQEALDWAMGHKGNRRIGRIYTKGYILPFARAKRLSRLVYKALWPTAKELPVKKAA